LPDSFIIILWGNPTFREIVYIDAFVKSPNFCCFVIPDLIGNP